MIRVRYLIANSSKEYWFNKLDKSSLYINIQMKFLKESERTWALLTERTE